MTPKIPLADLTPEDLLSAYNGLHGCACGCRGRHSYMNAAEGAARRGYPVYPDEVNRVRVANTLRTIKAHADEATYDAPISALGHGLWWYESETRLYIAYLR
jgi:hypothetical protein